MPKLNQFGIAPIILIIILTIIIAAVAGITYKSRKEIKLKNDQTSETAEIAETNNTAKTTETDKFADIVNTAKRSEITKSDSSTTSVSKKDLEIELANSGKLAEKGVELRVDNKVSSSPKFYITPPAGWEKFPHSGNNQVEFLSPSIDTVKEGYAYLKIQPNIIVFVIKENFKDLDEATAVLEDSIASSTYKKNKQKTKINGEEAYIIEFTTDITSSLRNEMEVQLKQTIATAGAKVSENMLRKDMDKLLGRTKTKLLSYSFYKNGYYVNVIGRSLESFWDQRGSVIKASLDTFRFE